MWRLVIQMLKKERVYLSANITYPDIESKKSEYSVIWWESSVTANLPLQQTTPVCMHTHIKYILHVKPLPALQSIQSIPPRHHVTRTRVRPLHRSLRFASVLPCTPLPPAFSIAQKQQKQTWIAKPTKWGRMCPQCCASSQRGIYPGVYNDL